MASDCVETLYFLPEDKLPPNIPNNSLSEWHFERKRVAGSYLRTLSSGLMLSTTIYAPPKAGLSQFILFDIVSVALDEGYLPVYVDLSNANHAVADSLLWGINEALEARDASASHLNFIKRLFGWKPNARKNSASQVQKTQSEVNANVLEKIHQGFQNLLKSETVLLIVDHAQELRQEDDSNSVLEVIATLIANNTQRLKPLYTTNDLVKWGGVFQARSSALFSEGAFVHNLPLLDNSFVRVALQRMGLQIPMEEAVEVFTRVQRQPGTFQALLTQWAVQPTASFLSWFTAQSHASSAQNWGGADLPTAKKEHDLDHKVHAPQSN